MEGWSLNTWEETAWTLFRSPKTELFKFIQLTSGCSLEISGHSIVLLQTDCTGTVEVFHDRALLVNRVILRWLSWNGRLVGSDTRERGTPQSLLNSWETELLKLVEIYLEDFLELAGHLVVTLRRETVYSHCWCLPG